MNALRTITKKTLRDLWRDRSRTLLVALSVAVGVLGIGLIVTTYDVLVTDLHRRYASITPAHVELIVAGGVMQDDLKGLASVPGVTAVQGRATTVARYQDAAGDWQSIEFVAFPEATTQTVNLVLLEEGRWPERRREIAVERASLAAMGLAVGDSLHVEAAGRELDLTIVGQVHQQDSLNISVRGLAMAVVDLDTMVMLRGHDRFDTVYLTTATRTEQAEQTGFLQETRFVADAARERLERAGYTIVRATVKDPAVHPLQETIDVLLFIMGALGVLALLLSGALVTNTMSALVAQQIDQIGMMKAIGADARLIRRIYHQTVLTYGLMGMALGIPLANRLGYQLAGFLAANLNFDLYPARTSWLALTVMIVVGLAVPLLAAMWPLHQGAAITVRAAIADYGLADQSNALVRWLGHLRGLARVWALALRNSVRNPARLALTLLTLSLGGGIFIAVLTTNQSLRTSLDQMVEVQSSMDVLLVLGKAERISEVLPLVAAHPAVARAEAWHFEETTMEAPSGQQVKVTIFAGPSDTQLYTPEIVAGRWCISGSGNEIVLNHNWAKTEGVTVGDTVTLTLEGEETAWVVVGFNQDKRAEETGVYLDLGALDRVLQRTDRTLSLQVQFVDQTPAHQLAQTQALAAYLDAHGVEVFSSLAINTIKARIFELFGVLVTFLLAMSLLIALVGGLALTGMMSINVLERRKEIGVMRAIGADTRAILQIFWGESMVVTLLSFALAVAASIPLARLLTIVVGVSFLDRPLDFTYAVDGVGYWLLVVLGIGTLASILPARSAANLSVRESLSYE